VCRNPEALDVEGQEMIETNWDECIETFDAMDLKDELLRGIYAYGFEKPSAIQQVRCMRPEKIFRARADMCIVTLYREL
jgi:hypothetical protein